MMIKVTKDDIKDVVKILLGIAATAFLGVATTQMHQGKFYLVYIDHDNSLHAESGAEITTHEN